MDNFLSLIPKSLLAFLAIAGGILLIVFVFSPPHTVCDSQLEIFANAEKRFLYKDPKHPQIVTTKFERLRDNCKITNNPGGCYELFQDVRNMVGDVSTMPSECSAFIGAVPQVKRAIWDSVDLLVRLAWGEAPPSSYHAKFGWLDVADISLFCLLKTKIYALYGEEEWTQFREKKMRELPGAADLPRNQVWDMSLFSENCARYP